MTSSLSLVYKCEPGSFSSFNAYFPFRISCKVKQLALNYGKNAPTINTTGAIIWQESAELGMV